MAHLSRHLIAMASMTYFGAHLEPGEPFLATQIDAEYFLRHGRARDALPSERVPELPRLQETAPASGGGDLHGGETNEGASAQTGAQGETNPDLGGTTGAGGETTAVNADSEAPAKPLLSAGLNVAQLREALEKRGVEIPANVTLKRELAALLDAQAQ